jgi:hypothetical protein
MSVKPPFRGFISPFVVCRNLQKLQGRSQAFKELEISQQAPSMSVFTNRTGDVTNQKWKSWDLTGEI